MAYLSSLSSQPHSECIRFMKVSSERFESADELSVLNELDLVPLDPFLFLSLL